MWAAVREVRDEKGGGLSASCRVVADLGLMGVLRDEKDEGSQGAYERLMLIAVATVTT